MRTLLAWWEMARLVLTGRYKRGSRYWAWRQDTAFGGPRKLSRSERARALRDFALWTRAMRRHTDR